MPRTKRLNPSSEHRGQSRKYQRSKLCFLAPKIDLRRHFGPPELGNNPVAYNSWVEVPDRLCISCVAFVQAYSDDDTEELEQCLENFQEIPVVVIPPTMIQGPLPSA